MWPWTAAWRLFGPSNAEDNRFGRLSLIRSVVGFVVILAVSVGYQPTVETMFSAVDDLWVTVMVAGVVIAVAVGLLVGLAVDGAARVGVVHRARVMRRPAVAGLMLFGANIWLVATVTYSEWNAFLTGLPAAVAVVVYVGFVWLVLLHLFGLWYSSRYLLRIGEVSPMLAPIAGSLIVTIATAIGWNEVDPAGIDPHVVHLLHGGGLITALGLGAAEVWSLHQRGHRLLGAAALRP